VWCFVLVSRALCVCLARNALHFHRSPSHHLTHLASTPHQRTDRFSFLEAATRYYELSSLAGRTVGGLRLGDDEAELALRSAIVCAVLAAVRYVC
jgi:hypothetical protein